MIFTLQYDKMIESEKPIARNRVVPRNMYRIKSYTYADGHHENLTGIHSALVFVFGRDQDTLYCLKINEVRPIKFFDWLATILAHKHFNWDNVEELREAIIVSDRAGKGIWKRQIHGKSPYILPASIYRTYKISSISLIHEIYFKTNVLKKNLPR